MQSKCSDTNFALLLILRHKLSKKAKLLVFKSIFIYILTYGHEYWVMTERVRSPMQAFKIRFLQNIKEVMMFDKVCNTAV